METQSLQTSTLDIPQSGPSLDNRFRAYGPPQGASVQRSPLVAPAGGQMMDAFNNSSLSSSSSSSSSSSLQAPGTPLGHRMGTNWFTTINIPDYYPLQPHEYHHHHHQQQQQQQQQQEGPPRHLFTYGSTVATTTVSRATVQNNGVAMDETPAYQQRRQRQLAPRSIGFTTPFPSGLGVVGSPADDLTVAGTSASFLASSMPCPPPHHGWQSLPVPPPPPPPSTASRFQESVVIVDDDDDDDDDDADIVASVSDDECYGAMMHRQHHLLHQQQQQPQQPHQPHHGQRPGHEWHGAMGEAGSDGKWGLPASSGGVESGASPDPWPAPSMMQQPHHQYQAGQHGLDADQMSPLQPTQRHYYPPQQQQQHQQQLYQELRRQQELHELRKQQQRQQQEQQRQQQEQQRQQQEQQLEDLVVVSSPESDGAGSSCEPSTTTSWRERCDSSGGEDNFMSIDELARFAKEFKVKRVNLGYTQAEMGLSIGSLCGRVFSQTTICRFEALQLSQRNLCKLQPLFKLWLDDGKAPREMVHRMRKKRTYFARNTRMQLEAYYNVCSKPNMSAIASIGQHLKLEDSDGNGPLRVHLRHYPASSPEPLLTEVVRLWFSNRRQKCRKASMYLPDNGQNGPGAATPVVTAPDDIDDDSRIGGVEIVGAAAMAYEGAFAACHDGSDVCKIGTSDSSLLCSAGAPRRADARGFSGNASDGGVDGRRDGNGDGSDLFPTAEQTCLRTFAGSDLNDT